MWPKVQAGGRDKTVSAAGPKGEEENVIGKKGGK